MNLQEGKVEFSDRFQSKITTVKIGNQGDLVGIGVGDGLVAFYSNSENTVVSKSLKYHSSFITSLIFNADDTRCSSTAYESVVYVWNTVDFKKSDKIKTEHNSAINGMIVADGGFISLGSDATIKKWAYAL